MADIVIADDYVETTGTRLKTRTEFIEKMLSSYLRILNGVRTNGIMEGETANALDQFISGVSAMEGKISNIGACAERLCKNMITRFDSADEYLY